MEVLHLKSLGILSHELICTISGVSPNTMRTYFKQFEEGGIEKLKEINFNKPKSELSNHSETIENYLRENPPATTSEAAYMIEQITGIKRGLTQTREFIKSLGVKLRKVGSIPAEALTDTKKKNKKNT
jgi:transposase